MSQEIIHSAVQDIIFKEDHQYDFTIYKEDYNYNKKELTCDVCNVTVTSSKILQRHLNGKRHKMKIERKDKSFVCDLCDVVANSEIQLKIHLNSSRHKHKVYYKEHPEYTQIPTDFRALWLLLFCVVCIFINLLLLFKNSL